MTIEGEVAETTATAPATAAAPRPRKGRKRDDEGGGEAAVAALESRLDLDDPELAAHSRLQRPDGEGGGADDDRESRQQERQEPPAGDDPPQDDAEISPGLQRVLDMSPQAEVVRPTKKEQRTEREIAKDSRKTAPSLKRLGELGKKIPGSEHVKVLKRKENGELGYVGEYNLDDLTQSQDFQSFLYRYVAPKFGPGEYAIRAVDHRGNMIDAGIVSILGPEKGPESTSELTPLDLLQKQLDRDATRRDQESRRPQQEKDPIDQMVKLVDLGDKLSSKDKGDGMYGTLLNGILQAQQRSEERVAKLLERNKEPDPLMTLLVTKLLEEKKEVPRGELPPMPAPVDPMLQMKAFAETMAAMMGTMVALVRPPQDSGNSELVKYLLQRADSDKLSSKDLIELMDKMRGERGTDDFKKSIDNLTLFMQLKNTMDGGGGSMLGEVVGALANSKLPDSIADFIRSRRAGAQQQQTRQLPADTGERDRMTRALEGAARRISQLEQQLQALQQQQQGTAPQAAAAPAQAQAAVVTPAPQVQAQPAQQQPAAVQQQAPASVPPGPTGPKLPPKIADHVNAIVLARDDDAALVEAAMQLLFYLTEPEVDEKLRQFGAVILEHVKRGEKDKTLEFALSFFGGLQKLGFFDQELCDKVVASLQAHFDEIVEYVNSPEDEDDDGDGGEDDDSAEGHTTQ